jgi:hypothetical protein
MKRFFWTYAKIRGRQYILDSLGIYRRFVVVFFIAYSLALGNDTPRVNAALGAILSNKPWDKYDVLVLAFFQLYALTAVTVTQKSLNGGRVQFLTQSLPLPISWERAVRAINLSLMNTVILLFLGFGLSTLLYNPSAFLLGILLGLSLYLTILILQIHVAERRWLFLPLGIVSGYVILMSRGHGFFAPALLLNLALFRWTLGSKAAQPREANGLFYVRSFQLRSLFLRRMPAGWILHIAYCLRKPALLIYALLGAAAAGGVLYMVTKQNIGLGQKVYVYTVINGFLSLLPAAYFETLNKTRSEHRIFLDSLPRKEKTWLHLDLSFVVGLFLLISFPTGLTLSVLGQVPLLLPLISLPLLALRYLAFHRSTATQEQSTTAVTILYGSLIWFGAVGWIADMILNR